MFIVLSVSMQYVNGGDNSSLIPLSHFHLHQLTTYRLWTLLLSLPHHLHFHMTRIKVLALYVDHHHQ